MNEIVAHTKCLKCDKDYQVGIDGYCVSCYDFSKLTFNPQRVNLQKKEEEMNDIYGETHGEALRRLSGLLDEADDRSKKDRDWLKQIIKVYDRTAATVPTEFDSKIGELRLYLSEKSEDGSISTS